MAHYSLLISEKPYENNTISCYGIQGHGIEIHDVSLNKLLMQAEIDRYNALDLAAEHVCDAIDNFLVTQHS